MTATAAPSRIAPSRAKRWDGNAFLGAVRGPAITIGVWAAGALVFFRTQWETGFDRLMGNDGDTRLIVYLLEHWFTVLHGRTSWANPAFYYPVKGILGWSDGFVLYEVLYVPFRLLGADEFLAAQLTVIALSLVGFVSFVALVRFVFSTPRWVALSGALIFTFANNLWVNAGRIQFFGLYLVPLVLLLGARATRALTRPRSVLLGGSCGVLAGLLFLTTFYVAWFAFLAGGVVLLVGVVLGPRRMLSAIVAVARRSWAAIMVALAGFAVAIVPFLDVYLPARKQVSHPVYNQVIHLYGVHLRNVVNTGVGNVMWGSLLRSLIPSLKNATGEMDYSVTPLLMIAALVSSGVAVWASRRRSSGRASTAAHASLVLAVAAIMLSLFPVRFQAGTLWIVVWHLPGGNAIRAPDRIEVVTGMVAVLALVAAVTGLRPRAPSRSGTVAIAGLICLFSVLVVEQVNTGVVSAINRPAEVAMVRAAGPPPSSCTSFYVVDSRNPHLYFFQLQTAAMVISQKVNLPTLNGYTAYDPPFWTLKFPGPDYLTGVGKWIDFNYLSNVCQLDIGTMAWTAGVP